MPAPSELPPPVPEPEAVRDAADEILSRPEFQQPPKSFYDRAMEWLGERFDDLLGSLFGAGRDALVGWLVLAAVAALVALLVWRILRTVRRDPVAAPSVDVRTEVRRTPREWEAEAEEHERAGRWRDALRCRHRALVAALARRGVVEEIPGTTAGEYRAAVRRALPDAGPDFAEATDLFERAWYGGRPAGADDGERFRSLSARVLEGASR